MFKNKPSAQAKHANSNPGIQKNGAKKEKESRYSVESRGKCGNPVKDSFFKNEEVKVTFELVVVLMNNDGHWNLNPF